MGFDFAGTLRELELFLVLGREFWHCFCAGIRVLEKSVYMGGFRELTEVLEG